MDIKLPRGKYVLAVSGGVDSMALLNMLSNLPGVELIIAHFDHGIRPDSQLDEEFVKETAGKMKLAYEAGRARLGAGASEERARQARYGFLRDVQRKYQADRIITAHHRDDYLETALLNLLRGTGRKGLTAISANSSVLRPLLDFSKAQIMDYAVVHGLRWREDPTNSRTDYLRNYLRHNVIPRLSVQNRQSLLNNLDKVAKINQSIDSEIATLSQYLLKNDSLNRSAFTMLPPEIENELLAEWFRSSGVCDFDRKTINRVNLAVKTGRAGTRQPIKASHYMEIGPCQATLHRGVGKLTTGLV